MSFEPDSRAKAAEGSIVKLRLLQTTDIHAYLVPYNYLRHEPTNRFGFALTAALIKEARHEAENSMLFDSGDALKGSPLGHFIAQKGLENGEIHPVFRTMNLLHYDAATVGNHDFNYGLDFLNEALDDANFPYVNANIYYDDGDNNNRHYFTPYVILPRTFVDESGRKHTIRVGVIGFTLPQTVQWDHGKLKGKVVAKDIYRTAIKYIPIMKQKGADVIVALSHSGLGSGNKKFHSKNASHDLAMIDGVDAILFGHVHRLFPGDYFADAPNTNLEKGTVNGVAAVEAGRWGSHLGVIDLTLKKADGGWEVIDSHSEIRPVYDKASGEAAVKPHPDVLKAVHGAHMATLNYLLTPAGQLQLRK
ncbi:MAG TPA: metallophosphoesterase [Bacillales bacterium]|nr:metallophosphoesterase [Bacillales bacterium]